MGDAELTALALEAVKGFAQWMHFTGIGSLSTLERALKAARRGRNDVPMADLLLVCGNVLAIRSDHAGARERFEHALQLYRQVDAVQGEANCIQRLGDSLGQGF